MEIIISKDTVKKCADFAEKRIVGSSKLYKARGEKWVEKIKSDIYNGALGEFGAYLHFINMGLLCSEPDLEIYEQKSKSYAPDLILGDMKLHVKSQSNDSAAKHGLSWTFQQKDPIVWAPKKDDYVIMTKVTGNLVELKALVAARILAKEHLFTEPRMALYGHTKTVVYYEELEASKIKLWEL